MKKPKAVVLLSGGLDSATTAAIAINEGFSVYCLSFDYGQRHHFELDCASKLATNLGCEKQIILKIELNKIGGSALTEPSISIPKGNISSQTIPVTYVPARNTIFLSFAAALAESIGCNHIYIGVNALDYSGYPDCRPEFISSFEKTINLGTKAGTEKNKTLKICTPLINMTKKEIILKGLALGVDFSLTHSCYNPNEEGKPCGKCDSCLLRLKGFSEATITDPLDYGATKSPSTTT